MQITKKHLAFLEEAKAAFEENVRLETYRNKDEEFIALRYGADRDCIQIFELGEEVGFFVQMMDKAPDLILSTESNDDSR